MYLVLSKPTEEYARQISEALWNLSRPESLRSPDDVSHLYTHWVVHPNTGKVALYVAEGQHRIHLEADSSELADIISDSLEEEEYQAIYEAIELHKGSSVSVIDIIKASPSLSGSLKTDNQIKGYGYFPEEDS